MQITAIIPIPNSKSRYRIYLDDEFAFVLYKGELRHYDIEIGNELTAETYQEITTQILPKRAKNRAFHLLKNRRYTEKQIRDKLKQGEYNDDNIDETITYLKSYNYINDEQYAKDYISYHINTKSRNRIYQDLFKKGIPFEMSTTTYLGESSDHNVIPNTHLGESTTNTCQDTEELERTQIHKWLEKKKYIKESADIKEKQRLFGFLSRKGYSAEMIKTILL